MNTCSKLDRFFKRGFVFTEGVRDQLPAIWELAEMALIKSSEAMGHLLEDPAYLITANAEFYESTPPGDQASLHAATPCFLFFGCNPKQFSRRTTGNHPTILCAAIPHRSLEKPLSIINVCYLLIVIVQFV
jgi:hypothetical protein